MARLVVLASLLVPATATVWPQTLKATPSLLASDAVDATATVVVTTGLWHGSFAKPSRHATLECAFHPDSDHRVPARWLNASAVECDFASFLAARPAKLNSEVSLYLDGNESYVTPYARASCQAGPVAQVAPSRRPYVGLGTADVRFLVHVNRVLASRVYNATVVRACLDLCGETTPECSDAALPGAPAVAVAVDAFPCALANLTARARDAFGFLNADVNVTAHLVDGDGAVALSLAPKPVRLVVAPAPPSTYRGTVTVVDATRRAILLSDARHNGTAPLLSTGFYSSILSNLGRAVNARTGETWTLDDALDELTGLAMQGIDFMVVYPPLPGVADANGDFPANAAIMTTVPRAPASFVSFFSLVTRRASRSSTTCTSSACTRPTRSSPGSPRSSASGRRRPPGTRPTSRASSARSSPRAVPSFFRVLLRAHARRVGPGQGPPGAPRLVRVRRLQRRGRRLAHAPHAARLRPGQDARPVPRRPRRDVRGRRVVRLWRRRQPARPRLRPRSGRAAGRELRRRTGAPLWRRARGRRVRARRRGDPERHVLREPDQLAADLPPRQPGRRGRRPPWPRRDGLGAAARGDALLGRGDRLRRAVAAQLRLGPAVDRRRGPRRRAGVVLRRRFFSVVPSRDARAGHDTQSGPAGTATSRGRSRPRSSRT